MTQEDINFLLYMGLFGIFVGAIFCFGLIVSVFDPWVEDLNKRRENDETTIPNKEKGATGNS